MGAAMISRLCHHYPLYVCESDKKRGRYLRQQFHSRVADLKTVISRSRVIILAVKPQNIEDLLKESYNFFTQDHLVISIAAGITTTYLEKKLLGAIRVIRTMPNLPAQIGKAMTAICLGKDATPQDLVLARRIFAHIGQTIVVEEQWMDAITAVSGSGPGYVFLFVECLTKAAQSLGLREDISQTLVLETLKGSLALWEASHESAGVLREKVTSKGGTTQAAMDVLRKNKLENIFKYALKAAQKRAKELSR